MLQIINESKSRLFINNKKIIITLPLTSSINKTSLTLSTSPIQNYISHPFLNINSPHILHIGYNIIYIPIKLLQSSNNRY